MNNHLAVDLGGVHNPMSQAVLLDAAAGATYNGMVLHQEYPRDIFAAELHMIGTLCELYQVTIPLYTLCPAPSLHLGSTDTSVSDWEADNLKLCRGVDYAPPLEVAQVVLLCSFWCLAIM